MAFTLGGAMIAREGYMDYRKAIERQRALLEQNPNDERLLQKMGELLQKAGDQKGAADAFYGVANCYLRDGFALSAPAARPARGRRRRRC